MQLNFWKVVGQRKTTYIYKSSIESFLNTAQKMKFSVEDFFSKCDQIRRFRRNIIEISGLETPI